MFRALPGKTAKHLFSVLVGAFFSWFVVGWTAAHVPASALLVYVLVQIVPRSYAPTVVFLTSVGWLSALHIWRIYVDYMGWSLDATMLLMIWSHTRTAHREGSTVPALSATAAPPSVTHAC